jgi:hypothetical protein
METNAFVAESKTRDVVREVAPAPSFPSTEDDEFEDDYFKKLLEN